MFRFAIIMFFKVAFQTICYWVEQQMRYNILGPEVGKNLGGVGKKSSVARTEWEEATVSWGGRGPEEPNPAQCYGPC